MNLTQALADYLRADFKPRGDEREAHISDLFGCDAATHARRRGEPMMLPVPSSLAKMQMGRDVELWLAEAIDGYLTREGWEVRLGARIAWDPIDRDFRFVSEAKHPVYRSEVHPYPIDRDFRFVREAKHEVYRLSGVHPCEGCIDCTITQTEIVGHIDIYATKGDRTLVGEIKSTSFIRGKTPLIPAPHYVEQYAGYHVATKATDGFIFVVCRESGRAVEFWNPIYDEQEIVDRAKEVLAVTSGLAVMPQPEPRESWQCKYCNFAACPKNVNPAKELTHA